MDAYKAVFVDEAAERSRTLHEQVLGATSIQGAIDEAHGFAPAYPATSLIDIFKGDSKVISVGIGPTASRT